MLNTHTHMCKDPPAYVTARQRNVGTCKRNQFAVHSPMFGVYTCIAVLSCVFGVHLGSVVHHLGIEFAGKHHWANRGGMPPKERKLLVGVLWDQMVCMHGLGWQP